MERNKAWSKGIKRKGKGVETSAVKYYKKKGIFAFRIPSDQQQGELRSIDYIVVLAGIAGQGKFARELLFNNSVKSKAEMARILSFAKKYSLDSQLAHRNGKPRTRVKFETLSKSESKNTYFP